MNDSRGSNMFLGNGPPGSHIHRRFRFYCDLLTGRVCERLDGVWAPASKGGPVAESDVTMANNKPTFSLCKDSDEELALGQFILELSMACRAFMDVQLDKQVMDYLGSLLSRVEDELARREKSEGTQDG